MQTIRPAFVFVDTFDPNFPDVLVPLGPQTDEEAEWASEAAWESGLNPYPKTYKCEFCGHTYEVRGERYVAEGCPLGCVSSEEYARVTATCEHGMAAWLCEGPMHYPADNPF
jgi:hypothetical protein